MRFKISKKDLYRITSKADRITSKNVSLPVLANIILEAKDNKVYVRSTNLDIGLEIKIKAEVEKEGVVAISGQLLNSFLNSLSKNDDDLECFVEKSNFEIVSRNSKTLIKTVLCEDFPNLPEVQANKVFTISSEDLISGLKSVWYASSLSSIKPELSSIYIYGENGELVFVATDSFRLAEKRLKIKDVDNFENVLIPYKNVVEIIKILEDYKKVDILFDDNQIAFKNEEIYLISRIVDGSFPDYKQIIPKDFETKVSVLREDFMHAMKTVNLFADKFNQIKIGVSGINSNLFMKTESEDKGNSENNIKIKMEGKDVEVNFNYRYILDCFNSITSDSLNLEFNGSNKPLIIKGQRDLDFTYLVMPMNK